MTDNPNLHNAWTRKDGTRPKSRGGKPVVHRLSIDKNAEPRIIVECKCGNNTNGRGHDSLCLAGWVFVWPDAPKDGQRIAAVCPKCAKINDGR